MNAIAIHTRASALVGVPMVCIDILAVTETFNRLIIKRTYTEKMPLQPWQ